MIRQRDLAALRVFASGWILMGVLGCTGHVGGIISQQLTALGVLQQNSIQLVSNTTSTQLACAPTNTIVLEVSLPASGTVYCRDNSALMAGVTPGLLCQGGPTIANLNVSAAAVDCHKLTLCGRPPDSITNIAQRFDGTPIQQYTFNNLPWGCQGEVDFSQNSSFSPGSYQSVVAQVTAPQCPFCVTSNTYTCLNCTALGNNTVVSGQLVENSCPGGVCASCTVPGTSTVVPHGSGYTFYSSPSGQCGAACNTLSEVRVCNNGYFEGDLNFSYSQCKDVVCGCNLGGTVYDSGTTVQIYGNTNPTCGHHCSDSQLAITCNNGTWDDPGGTPTTQAEFNTYSKYTCTDPVCNCPRVGHRTVLDGTSLPVYSSSTATCQQGCQQFQGMVACAAGVLTGTPPAALNYAYDNCTQANCGCNIPLANGQTTYLANGQSTTLYDVAQNNLKDLTACTDAANQVTVTCNNNVLTPSYNQTKFIYQACMTNSFGCSYNGVDIQSGGTLVVNEVAVPACGQSCQGLTITCNDGTWSEPGGGPFTSADQQKYPIATGCTPKDCTCPVNGYILQYQQSKTFYSTTQGTCDPKSCTNAEATLTCGPNNKVTGGDPAVYLYDACSLTSCQCPLPWGGSINNGSTVTVWSVNSATCTNPTACTNAQNFVTVGCNNGTLGSYDQQKFTYTTCAPAVCSCPMPQAIIQSCAGQTPPAPLSVNFGANVTFYSTQNPPTGTSCSQVANTYTCGTNGQLTSLPPAAVSGYPYCSCQSQTDQGNLGGTGGGTGNGNGPGSGIHRRFPGSGDGPGGPLVFCSDVVSCILDINNGYDENQWVNVSGRDEKACILPWASGEIEMYGSIMAFNAQCVVSPDLCSKHRQTRTCHYPDWTGSSSYIYPSCVEKASCP